MKMLEKGKIGNLELKNRIILAPMGYHMDNFGPQAHDYFVARAKGGAGLIIAPIGANAPIENPGMLAQFTEENLHEVKRLVHDVHAYGAKFGLQIIPGFGRVLPFGKKHNVPVCASPVPSFRDQNVICYALTIDEIKETVECFREKTILAKKAGVDAIEIHAYGGYLVDCFLSSLWNKRTDEYGGSLENRARFLFELIDVVQNECGKDYPLIVKFCPAHYMDGDGFRTIDEGLKIAKMLEKKGVHMLHVDAGCYERWYLCMPPIYWQEQTLQVRSAEQVKKVVSIPVAVDGKMGHPEKGEAVLQQEKADFLMIARGLLADPEMPNKLYERRADEIAPCIGCNEGCIARVMELKHLTCTVNPTAGRESTFVIKKAEQSKKVLIIGGGPGGLSAAIDAKQAGHAVELWEKTSRLGGLLIAAGRPYFKTEINDLVSYYRLQLCKLGIKVKLCTEATVESILAANPDVVILATGSDPLKPKNISGINGDNVVTAIDVLLDQATLGENLVIVGAGLVGCETALHLTPRGKKITLVEMQPTILPEKIFVQNKTMLTSLLNKDSNILIHTGAKLVRIEKDCVIIEKDRGTLSIPCDIVVLAMGLKAKNPLASQLSGRLPVISVGDCVIPRGILEAVYEAREAIISL